MGINQRIVTPSDLRSSRRAVMPYHPTFRSDKVFLPLQAADMVAGEMRLLAEDYPDNPQFIGHLCPHLPLSKWIRDIGEADMEASHEHLLRSLDREERERNALHKNPGCGD